MSPGVQAGIFYSGGGLSNDNHNFRYSAGGANPSWAEKASAVRLTRLPFQFWAGRYSWLAGLVLFAGAELPIWLITKYTAPSPAFNGHADSVSSSAIAARIIATPILAGYFGGPALAILGTLILVITWCEWLVSKSRGKPGQATSTTGARGPF